MRNRAVFRLSPIILASVTLTFVGVGGFAMAQSSGVDEAVNPDGAAQKLELTPAQRGAIYQAVSKDKSKVAPSRFPTAVGAEVPPMIELYTLPDDILAGNPVTKLYKYTMVQDQVVIVDPTNMRTIAVIGPRRNP
jgi:Protein of unknown function (DUF1236)